MKTWYQHFACFEENKLNSRKKGPQCCITQFYSKGIPMLNELVIKNTPVKELVLFYQPEEHPTLDQFSDKSVQCFLCLAVTILNFERG